MTTVAFIGLGTMGAPMARRLCAAGYAVRVHNRTRSKEAEVPDATPCESPRAAAEGADVVITMVSDSPDVREVVLGDEGAIHGMRAGATLVDMSTISPAVTREVSAALEAEGLRMVDAPVSGGSEGAQQGTLAVMAGGDAEAVDAVREVLSHVARTVTHVGPVGSGQVTKAINQVVIAGTYAAVAEGMALGLTAGLDMDAVVSAISGGAAASWVLDNRSGNMVRGEYPLGFRTRLHLKDLRIALEAAREAGLDMPVAQHVAEVEERLVERGHGDEDVSNVARVARESAGIDPAP